MVDWSIPGGVGGRREDAQPVATGQDARRSWQLVVEPPRWSLLPQPRHLAACAWHLQHCPHCIRSELGVRRGCVA